MRCRRNDWLHCATLIIRVAGGTGGTGGTAIVTALDLLPVLLGLDSMVTDLEGLSQNEAEVL